MPTLRNLICQVEWDGLGHLPLREYNTTYGDSFVETYLAVPTRPTNFAVHLTSNGYIATGLAMFVFINGEYQCNRNRNKLLIPAEGVNREDCEINFRLRQREYRGPDGIWEGRQWAFEKVVEGADLDVEGSEHAAQVGEYGGTIEVFVLRCYHSDPSKTRSSSLSSLTRSGNSSNRSSYMDDQEVPLMTGALFDGAGDYPPIPKHGRLHLYNKKAKEENPRSFRFGGGLFFSAGDDGLSSRHPKEMRAESPPSLRLRGGGGSESARSKKGVPSPSLSSRSYRPGSGDLPSRTKIPKGSSRSYAPEETWNAKVTDGATKPKQGSTGSYTPDEPWGGGGATQADNQWQSGNTWTWEPAKESKNSSHESPSQRGFKERKQRSSDNISAQNRNAESTGSWNWKDMTSGAAENNGQGWGTNDIKDNENWGSDKSKEDEQSDNWVTTENDDDKKDQQESGWDPANNDNSGYQNDKPGDSVDKSDQEINWASSNDLDNDRSGGIGGSGGSNAQFGHWDHSRASTPTQKNQDQKISCKGPSKPETPVNDSKSEKSRGRISKPQSVLDTGNRLNGSKRKVFQAPSVTSQKPALKSPFHTWASSKALPRKSSDVVVDRVTSIPGAWSPPLEIKDKKERSGSTKRKAAKFNAERAKARGAELNVESPKAPSHRSKPKTPLSPAVFKPISKSITPGLVTSQSKTYQSHRKRPSTIVEEHTGVADAGKDDGPIHQVRSLSPAGYTHKTGVPHYMDTIADPYAHFVFQYREMAVISRMCGVTVGETKEELQDRLGSLTKGELLQLLVEERMAANEEVDERLTWKSSPGKTGYRPNLNAANEKLDQWEKNDKDSGRNDQERSSSRENDWGNIDSSGGDGSNANTYQNHDEQAGDSWSNDNNKTSGDNQWTGEWANSNDNSSGGAGWADGSRQGNNNNNDNDKNNDAWGSDAGGGGGGGDSVTEW